MLKDIKTTKKSQQVDSLVDDIAQSVENATDNHFTSQNEIRIKQQEEIKDLLSKLLDYARECIKTEKNPFLIALHKDDIYRYLEMFYIANKAINREIELIGMN